MPTWIALFRGINVGGNHLLPMAKLREALESLGFGNVITYIQSGNVVFDSTVKATSAIRENIARRIEEQHGFHPSLILLKRTDLRNAIESNPFPEGRADPKSLHFSFLEKRASHPDLEMLEDLRAPSERFELLDRVFYLHAPDGIGRSKLAARAEKCLGVMATARNYRTVEKLLSMATQR